MFLWRSLTPAAIANVAAALTRAKPAAPAAGTTPDSGTAANGPADVSRQGIAKS